MNLKTRLQTTIVVPRKPTIHIDFATEEKIKIEGWARSYEEKTYVAVVRECEERARDNSSIAFWSSPTWRVDWVDTWGYAPRWQRVCEIVAARLVLEGLTVTVEEVDCKHRDDEWCTDSYIHLVPGKQIRLSVSWY